MGTLNDEILRATGGPTVQDGLRAYFSATAQETVQDAELRFLQAQVGVTTATTIADAWAQFLSATPGTLNDKQLAYWTAQAGGFSPAVTAVFARMSALTQTEMDAIEVFVDGLTLDGSYSFITEIYAPCLNATDFLTGFKFMDLVPSASAPVHTAGEFVEFSTNAMHYLDSADFDTFANVEGFIGVYNIFTAADSTGNSDLFGLADASNECYYRWRGTDSTDFNAIYNVTTATPRSASNQRPTGDMVGMGLEGVDLFELQPGGIVVKSTRITTPVPAGHPCQWHGQNLNGTPAAGNMANSRYSLMIHSNLLLSTVAQGSVRGRSLQFLRDIGVTGIPAT